MQSELDHVIWAVPDLDDGIVDLERRLGVRATYGGRHPGVGTHNALLDLGDRRYLEILAPDPSQTRFSSFGKMVRDLRTPKLLSWAARTDDIEAVSTACRDAGLRPGVVLSLSRRTPDGITLSWRLLQIEGHGHGPLFPFFIEWRGALHPADGAPQGCMLESLRVAASGDLQNDLAVVALEQAVATEPPKTGRAAAGEPDLTLVLATPRGRVVLA